MSALSRPTLENRIWALDELMPREELRVLQLERLISLIDRAANIPFYKETFKKHKISSSHIRSLDDIKKLPFTTKKDLQDAYPWGFFAVPKSELARLHGSSGTTGKPVIVGYTNKDMECWANLCARFLVAGGLKREHLVHIAFGYGLFTGGFGLHQGVEKIGAAVIPVSSGNTQRQVSLIKDLEPDVLICTPSYALNIVEVAQQLGEDPRAFSLKIGHFGAEPWTEDMRSRIEMELGIVAFNNYGLSEIIGPGVSGECFLRDGMHIQEDHFLVECLNPETLEPVPEGEPGELVITTLTKQAFPLIRYRTRDICSLNYKPCSCGRTGVRMSRIIGRSDDMLIIRGVNVFPSQIEQALLRVEGTAPHYLIEVDRPGTLDEVKVKVEMRKEVFTDSIQHLHELQKKIEHEIFTNANIRVEVELVKPQTLERFTGKAKRVIDRRKII